MTEIQVPLRELRQLASGDDNVLGRQYMIENTIHRVMKIMNTHNFSKQIFFKPEWNWGTNPTSKELYKN